VDPNSADPLANSRLRYLQRLSSSLGGTIAFFQVVWGLPMNALFLWLLPHQGEFGWKDAVGVLLVNALAALAVAAGAWFFVLRALTRRRAELIRQRRHGIPSR